MSTTLIAYGRTPNLKLNIKKNGADFDPATIELQVTDPSGDSTTYTFAGATITKDSVGNYSKVVPNTKEASKWKWRWKVTQGTTEDYAEGTFEIQPSNQRSPI